MFFRRSPSHGSFIFSLNVSNFFVSTALRSTFSLFSFRRSVSCITTGRSVLAVVLPFLCSMVSFCAVCSRSGVDGECAVAHRIAAADSNIASGIFMVLCALFVINELVFRVDDDVSVAEHLWFDDADDATHFDFVCYRYRHILLDAASDVAYFCKDAVCNFVSRL